MDKKYPKDTPVTLQMLAEILDRSAAVTASVETKKMIEPPKPEPKEGEWWLCRYKSQTICQTAVLVFRDGKFYTSEDHGNTWGRKYITPLYKMVPAKEGE